MSPVGPYPDFDACLDDNKEKENPEGFCGWLEKQTNSLSDEQVAEFEKAAKDKGWVLRNGGWGVPASYQAMATRTVANVQIFAVGEHNGDIYTEDDLSEIVRASKALKGRVDPPLKVGHTTDTFNKDLARKLGIPEEIVSGEGPFGDGAMALGWVGNLRVKDNKLYGDFRNVPVPIADLIESRSFNEVSAEILFEFEDRGEIYRRVLTGVALLGAQLPAVRETAGLETAVVFAHQKIPTKTYTFQIVNASNGVTLEDHEIEPLVDKAAFALEQVIKGKAGAPIIRAFLKDIKARVRSILKRNSGKYTDEEVDMKEILRVLGLKEEATEEVAVTAIKALQEKANIDGKVELKEMAEAIGLDEGVDKDVFLAALKQLKEKSEVIPVETKEFADLKVQNEDNQTKIAKLTRDSRIAHFTEQAAKWSLVSGKPGEIAEKLVSLEEKDKGAAEDLVKIYEQTQASLTAAGADKPKGTPAEGHDPDETAFEKKIGEYMEKEGADWNTGFNAMCEEHPALFRDYMANRKRVYATTPEPAQ